jgi:hypothetical protein
MEKQYLTQYPSDVSDEEWSFVAPYLTLCREDAPQREHSLRAVFFAWAARFRRLARDYERLNHSLAGYHYFAFAWIMLAQLTKLLNKSS